MPGVPPDALAQVKKGLKGLFSRKKKEKSQSSPSTSSTAAAPTASDKEGATNAAGTDPVQRTLTEERAIAGTTAFDKDPAPVSGTPHISEPAEMSESKNIDLNPSASDEVPSTSTPVVSKETMVPEPGKLDSSKLPTEGMSATSGPLSDDLGAGYGEDTRASVEEQGGKPMGGEGMSAEGMRAEGESKMAEGSVT